MRPPQHRDARNGYCPRIGARPCACCHQHTAHCMRAMRMHRREFHRALSAHAFRTRSVSHCVAVGDGCVVVFAVAVVVVVGGRQRRCKIRNAGRHRAFVRSRYACVHTDNNALCGDAWLSMPGDNDVHAHAHVLTMSAHAAFALALAHRRARLRCRPYRRHFVGNGNDSRVFGR